MKSFIERKNVEYNPFGDNVEKKQLNNNKSEKIDDVGLKEQYGTISLDGYIRKQREKNSEVNKEWNKKAILIRVSTQESISINKAEFIIGRKTSNDIFKYDLSIDSKYISRCHAGIISRNGKYYITDYESVNKTYLNDRIVPKNQELEICSGAKIKLADVEFIFKLTEE